MALHIKYTVREGGRDDEGVDDRASVIGDQIHGAALADLEVGIERAVVAVAARIHECGLARADLGVVWP